MGICLGTHPLNFKTPPAHCEQGPPCQFSKLMISTLKLVQIP